MPLSFRDCPFLVINLKRRPDRLDGIRKQFEGRTNRLIVVEAFDALDPSFSTILPSPLPYLAREDRRMTPGECALTLGHAKALDMIEREGFPVAVVLEDDAVLDWGRLDAIAIPDGLRFDFVKLQATEFGRRGPSAAVYRGNGWVLEARREFSMGSVAYAVTAQTAGRMAATMRRSPMPSDHYLAYAPAQGLRGLEVTPSAVGHDDTSASDLEGSARRTGGLKGPLVWRTARAWLAIRARLAWILRRD